MGLKSQPLFWFLFLFHTFSPPSSLSLTLADAGQLSFPNPRLRRAYLALQIWKTTAIFSDPKNITSSWVGPNVCSYAGIYCAPLPSRPSLIVVAGIDLNAANIAGYLPVELAFLSDLALLHLNSNRFCGSLPLSLGRLHLLHELDLSNNRFAGNFPSVVLSLPSLRFLDLRFNNFEGPIPPALFTLPIDAIFLNSNRLRAGIPQTLGDSPASVIVLANNNLGGCIPSSIGKMGRTLDEIILLNDHLTGCIPPDSGDVRVFDVGFNQLQGPIPASFAESVRMEQLNIGQNRLTGRVSGALCLRPKLRNFTFSYNFFTGEAAECSPRGGEVVLNGRRNCFAGRPDQRPPDQCTAARTGMFDCGKVKCEERKSVAPPLSPRPRIAKRIPPSPPAPVGGTHRGFFTLTPPPAPTLGPPPCARSYPPPSPPFEDLPQLRQRPA